MRKWGCVALAAGPLAASRQCKRTAFGSTPIVARSGSDIAVLCVRTAVWIISRGTGFFGTSARARGGASPRPAASVCPCFRQVSSLRRT